MAAIKKIAGVAWFKRHNYDKLRRTFLDGHTLPAQFDDWLRAAKARCTQIADEGREAVLVEIEPDEFIRWCKAHQYRTDARARDSYTKLMAYRIAMGTQAPVVIPERQYEDPHR